MTPERLGCVLLFALSCTGGGGGTATATDSSGSTAGETDSDSGVIVDCPVLEVRGNYEVTEPQDESDVIGEEEGESFPAALCPDLQVLQMSNPLGLFKFGLYRPATSAGGPWPDNEQFPLVVFAPGRPLEWYGYREILTRLAKAGFVVVSVDIDPLGLNEVYRSEMLACAARWLLSEWSESGRLDGRVVFSGHSAGGEGALIAPGKGLGDVPGTMMASVAIAPSQNSSQLFFDYLPTLLVQGASDEDPTHASIKNYDRINFEPWEGGAGKSLVWAYDIPHLHFGGLCSFFQGCSSTEKGEEIASEYARAFLRWYVFGEVGERQYFSPPGNVLPGAVGNDEFWPDFDSPRVFGDFRVDGKNMGGARVVVDDFEMGGNFSSVEDTLSINVGPAIGFGNSAHRSNVLQVEWQPDSTGRIRWDVSSIASDLAGSSFLNLRVGQHVTIEDEEDCIISPNGGAAQFSVRFITENDEVVGVSTSSYGEIPVQGHRAAPILCTVTSFMRTIRVPMDVYCSAGHSLEELKFIDFVFDETTDPAEAGSLHIDSIEFSSSPFDDAGSCGAQPICAD